MAEICFTILGCGSSGGVPRIGADWGDCNPDNPKNRRSRCSLLIERKTENGITRVLVDTSPDLRTQLLNAEIDTLDGVVYTHGHADHVHGIDDLRTIVINMRKRMQVWADGATQNRLLSGFGYAFIQPDDSPYPPILDLNTLKQDLTIDGAGGPINLRSFEVQHGSIRARGFRIGDFAYLPDVSHIPDDVWPELQNLHYWVVDALRMKPHPSHAHLDLTLEWIAKVSPKNGVLTNMHIDLDYDTVMDTTPEHVVPAYDGMQIRLDD